MLAFKLKRAGVSPRTLKKEENELNRKAREELKWIQAAESEIYLVPALQLQLIQRKKVREALLKKAARRRTLRKNLRTITGQNYRKD